MSNTLNFGTIREARIAEWLKSFIILPAFQYDNIGWKGASEIITQFNYTATKNFTLRTLPTPPVNTNFCLVIRYRVGLISYRYKLWSGVGETLNEKLYNGEIIKKNFVLEIWNTQQSTTVSLLEALTVNISIRKIPVTYASLDNYADNTVVAEAPSQNIAVTSGTPPAAGLLAHYKPEGLTPGGDGTTVVGWTESILGGVQNLSLISHLNTKVVPALNGYAGVRHNGTGILRGSPGVVTNMAWFLVCKQNSWTLDAQIARQLNPNPTEDQGIKQGNLNSPGIVAFMQSTSSPPNLLLPIGNFDIIKYTGNITTDIATVSVLGNDLKSTGSVIGTALGLDFQIGPADVTLVEILIYDNSVPTNDEEIYKYLLGKFGLGIAIPMVVNSANPWLDNS